MPSLVAALAANDVSIDRHLLAPVIQNISYSPLISTLQEHSASPNLLVATHEYFPPSSSLALETSSEHRPDA